MKPDIAHYTLVRLLPQVDAGEFANIGVLLACPKQGFFGFRLIKRYGRVTRFFEEFAGELFVRVRREIEAELRHIRIQISTRGAYDQILIARVLQDLTQPRDSMVRYSSLRLVMTDDAEAELNRLVARYVQRDVDGLRQRREEVLARHVTVCSGRSNWPVRLNPKRLVLMSFRFRCPWFMSATAKSSRPSSRSI